MKSSSLVFVQEAVYFKYKNEYYSDRIEYSEYWQRYFNHFDKIVVLARVRNIEELTLNLRKSSGDNIDFIELPYYNGFMGYLKNKGSIIDIFKNNLNRDCTYILRIPGPLGSLYARVLKQNKIDYVVEVVGDPEEVIKHLALPIPNFIKNIIARYAGKKMQAIVANAKGALYVTTSVLQKKYPTFVNIPTVGASNVIIHNSNIVQRDVKVLYESIQGRLLNTSNETVKIGVLGRLYAIKSPMEILESIINLINYKGYNLEIIFAGDSPF